MSYLDELKRKREEEATKKQRAAELKQSTDTTKESGDAVAAEVVRQAAKTRTSTQKVRVENKELAQSKDVQEVVDSINRLNVTTFMASKDNWTQVVEDMATAAERIQGVIEGLESGGVKKIEKSFTDAVASLQSIVGQIKKVKVETDSDVKDAIRELATAVNNLDVTPVVNVPEQKVTVQEREIDLSPLTTLLSKIESGIRQNKVEVPKTDFSSLENAISGVKKSIESLTFPVPNYILPFKDVNGRATQVQLDGSGNLPITASISGADGAITDGASPTIKATVKDLSNSNPLTVAIVDTSGDQIASFGGGTQYTVDDIDDTATGTLALGKDFTDSMRALSVDASGVLNVNISDGGTPGFTDDVTFTPADDVGVLMMGAATSDTVNAGAAGVLAMDVNRNLKVIAQANSGVDIGDVTINNATIAVTQSGTWDEVGINDSGNSITVDNGGTFAVQDSAAETSLAVMDDWDATAGSAHPSDGVMAMGSDGTNARRLKTDSSGELQVDVLTMPTVAVTQSGTWDEVGINDSGNSITVDNGGTFVVQENGSWVQADDAAFTPATSKVAMIGAEFDDTSPDSVDEGDGGAVRMSGRRELYTQIRDAAGNERGLKVDTNGAIAATVTNATASNLNMTEASAASSLTSLQLIDDVVYTDDTSTHSTGSSKGVGIMATATPTDTSVNANDIGMVAMTTDRRLLVDASGVAVPVTDNSSSLSVDWNGTQPVTGSGTATGALRVELANNGTGLVGLNAGTNAIGKLAANSGVDIGDVDITSVVPGTSGTSLGKAEDASHTTGDTGVAVWSVSNENITAFGAASGDYTPSAVNRYGHRYITSVPPSHASSNGTPITSTTTSVISAPSAGNHLRVTRVHISNGGATATWVSVRDGAAGTQHYRTYLMQGAVMSLNLNESGPLDLTTATRLDIVLSAAGSVEYEVDYLTVAD